MPYHVKIRKKNPSGKPGACFGTFGPFTTQAQAKRQAQVLADQASRGHVVTVEPVVRRTNRKKKRKRNITSAPASTGGAISNPRHRMHKGHSIGGSRGNYVVEAYGKSFKTLKAAKAWIDRHVAAELRRLNPKKKSNPRVRRKPPTRRANASISSSSSPPRRRRTFGGKTYSLKTTRKTAAQAGARAASLRKEGYLARTCKHASGIYCVYARKKK